MHSSVLIESRLPCPLCNSSDAYHKYSDGHGYCFSCNQYTPAEGGTNVLVSDGPATYEFLPWRGIARETMARYGVKTKIDREGKPISIGFPYANGSFKIRWLDRKDFYSEGDISKAGLFGKNLFSAGSHRFVTLTEGEADALSLYQVCRSPVVSVQSASSALRDCIADRSWLNSFERVYLAFDADAPGRSAAREVARLFDYNKVFQVKFTKRKDANAYLEAGEADELLNIWNNAKKYVPENVVSSFSEFKDILNAEEPPSISFPWPKLNSMTYGMRMGESVLITAQEKVGKTELMHAIEHHILKETDYNVAAIFIEEPKRRHLQAVAGIEIGKQIRLPDSGVTDDQTYDALKVALRRDDRLYVYSHFGSDDPDVLLDTIRFLVTACDCRVVMFDHISMAVSGLAGDDERRALDYLSTRLEMMVKELGFLLIFVSHVNDDGKTRGSRYISKVADVRIDLSRDLQSGDERTRNSLLLTLAFSRFSSESGPAGTLLFDPVTGRFTQLSSFAEAGNEQQQTFGYADNRGNQNVVYH